MDVFDNHTKELHPEDNVLNGWLGNTMGTWQLKVVLQQLTEVTVKIRHDLGTSKPIS